MSACVLRERVHQWVFLFANCIVRIAFSGLCDGQTLADVLTAMGVTRVNILGIGCGVLMRNLSTAPPYVTLDWKGPEMDQDNLGVPQIRMDIGIKYELNSPFALKG